MTAATSTLTRENGSLPAKMAASVGKVAIGVVAQMGKFTFFCLETLRGLPEVKIWFPRFLVEAWNIGVGSFFLVLLIAGFAGAAPPCTWSGPLWSCRSSSSCARC